MIHVLDSMIDVITPEMPRQIARWGGNLATWENNVQDLRDFILARCPEETSNNDVVEGIEDCYDVTQHLLTVQINGPGVVFLEDTPISVNNAPYTGTFLRVIPLICPLILLRSLMERDCVRILFNG